MPPPPIKEGIYYYILLNGYYNGKLSFFQNPTLKFVFFAPNSQSLTDILCLFCKLRIQIRFFTIKGLENETEIQFVSVFWLFCPVWLFFVVYAHVGHFFGFFGEIFFLPRKTSESSKIVNVQKWSLKCYTAII